MFDKRLFDTFLHRLVTNWIDLLLNLFAFDLLFAFPMLLCSQLNFPLSYLILVAFGVFNPQQFPGLRFVPLGVRCQCALSLFTFL